MASQQVSEPAAWSCERALSRPPAMETQMETAKTVHKTQEPAQAASSLEEQNRRLQTLVGELILDNQELRFKMAHLEAELEKSERGLKAATQWAGMLF